MPKMLIDVKGLEKTYRLGRVDVHALQGVDFHVEQGEFTAVAGPSGSGKTTLLNLISGLDTPTAGTVRLGGTLISDMSEAELGDFRRDHIGFIFQSYNLIPVLTVEENIEYIMQLQGIGKQERQQRVGRILSEVGLSGMERRKPMELSGGQQQRVAVARAIVSRPDIVLADEPTANLDSKTGRGLLDLMQQLNQTLGITFLFSTHDTMIMEHARRLVRLQDGQVVRDE